MKKVLPAVPKRILLIRLKGIGDVILSTPLVRALRKAFPQAEIHFLTRSLCAPILKHNPYVDRVLVHPEKSASSWELLRFLQSLRSARYDWVLDLAAEPRSAWLTLATGASLRAGYAFRIRKWAFNFVIPKNTVRKYQA
ncbi:MAG TPA: glycosyltransferase family 9 protein, partial [bacterium]|nr:glycosyltransferase family 9 protein [bacterium]